MHFVPKNAPGGPNHCRSSALRQKTRPLMTCRAWWYSLRVQAYGGIDLNIAPVSLRPYACLHPYTAWICRKSCCLLSLFVAGPSVYVAGFGTCGRVDTKTAFCGLLAVNAAAKTPVLPQILAASTQKRHWSTLRVSTRQHGMATQCA